MTEIKIEVQSDTVTAALNRLVAAGQDMAEPMMAIAGILHRQAEDNFAAQSGPLGKWPPLAQATLEARVDRLARGSKSGKLKSGRISKSTANAAAGIKMLQDSGRLAASVTPYWTKDEAGIGSNAIYAAIHHLGGQAGQGLKVTIPARPYLPGTQAGLQAGVEEAIVAELARFIESAV